MKKALFFIAALSLFAVACEEKENEIDWSKVTVDGFYVAGPATGSAEIKPECVMSAGFNEAEKEVREGMYEKYIVLEGEKDFYLAYSDGGKLTYYSAKLEEFVTPLEEAYYGNPEKVLKGKLIIGDSPVAMKVAKTGLYHIVLDINKLGDLREAQILLLDASDFGVRGGMNGWGFSSADAVPSFSNAGTTFVFSDQELATGGSFKFATGNYWKVTLDDAGKVKAETSLGETGSGLGLANAPGKGDNNISVEKAGKYKITLTYKLSQGAFNRNFSYSVECTEESTVPEEMYMIGEGIEGWGLENDPSEAVAMHPFHSQPGKFWAIRYIEAGKGFKFSSSNKKWGSDFTGDGAEGEGYTVDSGNCFVAESGLYTLQVDAATNKVFIEPAVIVGMDAPFGNPSWDANNVDARFTIEDNLAKFTTVADGSQIRTFVYCSYLNNDDNGNLNWWHAEFIPKDGGIVYREGGNDPEQIAIEEGKVITYDFNAGTSSIEDAVVFEPAINIDGAFEDWAEIASAEPSDSFTAFKITNDEKNFYFYVETDPGSRLWSGGAYMYLYFDFDNDLTTGSYSGSTGMGDNSYEAFVYMFLFGGSADAPEINANPSGESSGMTMDNIAVGDNKPATSSDIVIMEIKIPRDNFVDKVNAGDVIGVGAYRSKDGGNVHFAGYTVK